MMFTYEGYSSLLSLLNKHRFEIATYDNWREKDRCVILRHDVDYDLLKAMQMAKLEEKQGVQAIYFVLLTSDFYNVFSANSFDCMKQIMDCGHTIGLHFDEVRYPEYADNVEGMKDAIIEEAGLLGRAIGTRVTADSMHRPGKSPPL